LIVNHFTNFETGKKFKDVHSSVSEMALFRGSSDTLGYRDGGDLSKIAVLKLGARFGSNNRSYVTNEMDLLNMRFFTENPVVKNPRIDNFYAIRLEDFRGNNTPIIKKGWGIYMKPSVLNNFFGGNVGIGTENVTHKLTIEAEKNPLKIGGLANSDSLANAVLTVNNKGEVTKKDIRSLPASTQTFFVTKVQDSLKLEDKYDIYIHKGVGPIKYVLPDAKTRIGKTWRIVNLGTGTIYLSCLFREGDDKRCTIIPNAGANTYLIFSDGEEYISLE
ncbi:MAG: hypothetical protein ACRCVT_10420, partial [Leadbetterella sp.]